MSRRADTPTPHQLLSELEEAVNTHIEMLKHLKVACIKLKRGEKGEDYLARRMRAIRRIRSEILENLRRFEDLEGEVDSDMASDIVAMVAYIEMSAVKDEKRYLLLAKKVLGDRGSLLNIDEDLKELEEIASSARRIAEKYSRIS